ncbi:HD domain-containing phosphohydrolase [Noviherbaspirillum sp.]|jgi:HD-GYP domain-containing protein (c-di-GMP phosphodiesterase class II)|uniref:HD-GYP domain-containing protein n=1 Tax=Noviherbaspirillum sp. TaxID=1926288 RepID=UPI0025D25438|nr:HD domain-containing phosphohydrolase [Noviherbaspirillum sp.]
MVQQPTNESDLETGGHHAGTLSVLHLINRAHKRLEHLLFNLAGESDVQASVVDIARALTHATDLNPDIALACILLNQEEGSYAVRHCIDSAVVALLVARALQKGPAETLTIMAAALTMNVGMLPSQEQLQSRLNAISDQELALIHNHPQQGVDMLARAGVADPDWLSYVLAHHENEDGSGYPLRKTGDEIPFNAKIISLADRYCARVSSRSYRKSLLPNEALSDILLADHDSVDPMLTTCFIGVLGIYPTGAIVRLANGEIGVVAGKGGSPTTPVVHALIGPQGAPLSAPIKRDTANAQYTVREMLSEERAGVRFSMQQVWGDEARP